MSTTTSTSVNVASVPPLSTSSTFYINTGSTPTPDDMYNAVNNFMLNPFIVFIILFIIGIYIIFFSSFMATGEGTEDSVFGSFSNKEDNGGSMGKYFIGFIVIVLLLLISVKLFQYFFQINVTAYFTNLFTSKPTLDIVVNQNENPGIYQSSPVPEIKYEKQVFNIPGNTYTYGDAKALCTAYGAKLATYQEIEDSYKHGGEWCNYGWSDGQMALFPTQQKTFDQLQKTPGHEHDCGRPGINGGYIANPEVKFGVNCSGYKPKITQEEADLMQTTPPYPVTEKDLLFQQRVDYWKNNIASVLVSPFNHKYWSQII